MSRRAGVRDREGSRVRRRGGGEGDAVARLGRVRGDAGESAVRVSASRAAQTAAKGEEIRNNCERVRVLIETRFVFQNFKDELLINADEELSFDMADLNAGDSPSSGQSSVCSIPGSPVSHRSGRAQRKEGQRDLHCSSFSVASEYRKLWWGNDEEIRVIIIVELCRRRHTGR